MALNIFKRPLRCLSVLPCCFALLLVCFASRAVAEDSKVAVVVSSEIRPFVLSLEGFRSEFHEPIDLSYVSANPELVRHKLGHETFDLVIAIGPKASRLVWSTVENGTKVALMVLDPQEFLHDPGACCVDLRVPMDEQIRLIAEHLGLPRNIGILFNPAENRARMEDGEKAGRRYGVNVVPLPVEKRDEVQTTLTSAYGSIDTLLFIPDSTVISETMVSHLVKDALLHGVASVGYNHFFLETGAVLAFTIDYRAVGVLGAHMAEDILRGVPCARRPPPFEVEHNERALKLLERNRQHGAAAQRRDGSS